MAKGKRLKLHKFFIGLLTIFICAIIIVIFAVFDYGLKWENLSKTYVLIDHLMLILFKILIYGLPALLLFGLNKITAKIELSLLDFYSIQFITYAIIKVIWDVLGINYLLSTTVFEGIDSFVIVISLFLTLIFKKEIKIKKDII